MDKAIRDDNGRPMRDGQQMDPDGHPPRTDREMLLDSEALKGGADALLKIRNTAFHSMSCMALKLNPELSEYHLSTNTHIVYPLLTKC